jgi:imidazolonepropionase-like amidohydrolase
MRPPAWQICSAAVLLCAACGRAPSPPAPGQPPVSGGSSRPPVAITNVTVVDVSDGRRVQATVVITEGLIAAIGQDAVVPADALWVDGTNKFLIPGLWDMHAHIELTGSSTLDLMLAHGVTGARDMGSDPDFILPLRDRISRGETVGPEIVAAGPILDTLRAAGLIPAPTEYFARMRRRVTNGEEARTAVRDLKARGVDFVKVHDRTPREAFVAIAEETKAVGLPFAGHVPLDVSIEEAADAGIRSIEHFANFRVFDDCSVKPAEGTVACAERFDRLAAKGIWQSPTLAFAQAIPSLFTGSPLPHAEYASDSLIQATKDNAAFSKLSDDALAYVRARNVASLGAVRDLHARGNGFLAACDALVPGICLHDELEWFAKAGLSPLQALQTATLNPARFLNRDGVFGRIAVRARADLVLLDADPLTDIRNTRGIAAVIVRGRLLAKADVDRMTAAHRRVPASR